MRADTLGAYNIADLREIAIFREEIDRTLALLGCSSIAALNREYRALPRSGERA
jgi:isopentenyl diphosphate isomerase/L-lactate dehydrogenase-like FMN-dependent dehydrogenase